MQPVSETCFNLIKKFEGISLTPYLCNAGVPTIGYGSTWYEVGQPVSMKDPPITKEIAEAMLRQNLKVFWNTVYKLTRHELNDNQMSALTSLAYNIGLSAFSTSTLLRKVNGNPDDQSIADEFRRWNKVNGAVIRGLVNRRNEEAKIYFSPIENVAQV